MFIIWTIFDRLQNPDTRDRAIPMRKYPMHSKLKEVKRKVEDFVVPPSVHVKQQQGEGENGLIL